MKFQLGYRGLFRLVGNLYETSGCPAGSSSVTQPNTGVGAGRAIWPRPLVRAPYQNPPVRARSTPSSGGLPQRSGAPRSSGAARRGRVARGTAVSTSVPHAIAAAQYCAESSRTPGHKTTKKTETYLTPGDPILVEVALPRASFNLDVDFWWSFVWSFTPDRMVTMFVSRTIPAITISSKM